MPQKQTQAWRNPNFSKLWFGQTISLLGSHIGSSGLRYTALLILVATPSQISWLTAAAVLPTLILSLPIGVAVDRVRRRPLLIAADIGRAMFLLAIPIAYVFGWLQIELLYVIAILTGSLTVLFETSYHAILPTLLTTDQLHAGNSKLSISASLAEVAGPPLGGVLVQAISAPFTILADAGSFLVSGLMIWRIQTEEVHIEQAQPSLQLTDLLLGLRAAWGQPIIRRLLVAAIISGLIGGIIGSLYDLYFIRDLGLSPTLVGIVIGTGGVAAVVGGVIAERVSHALGVGRTMALTALISGCSLILLPIANGRFAVLVLLLAQLSDLTHPIYAINEASLRQTLVPTKLLGQVGAAFQLLPTSAVLLGALATGPLVASLSLRGALACGALLALLRALWLFGSPLMQKQATIDPPTR